MKTNQAKKITYQGSSNNKRISSLPLNDYVEIGIFGKINIDEKNEKELYLKKHKVARINNKVSIIVDDKPLKVGVDPHFKLIDPNRTDNLRVLNLN